MATLDIPIQAKQGAVAGLPTGLAGEWLFTTDTHKMYYGDGATNYGPVVLDNDSRLTDARTPVGTTLSSAKIWVGNGSNVAAAVSTSGDVTIDNTGVQTIGSNKVVTAKILNSNVTLAKIANASASSKLLGSGASGSGAAYTEITLDSSLTMTGTTLSASGGGGGGSPGGSDTYVQYNDVGSFGGDANFVWNKTNQTLTITGGGGGGALYALDIGYAPYRARFVGPGTTNTTALFEDGTNTTAICSAGTALNANDGTRTVKLADGTYAVNATIGHINTPGTSGNTYRWGSNTTTPSTNLISAAVNRYGGDTNYLGDPDAWILVNINGTDYKLPAYL